MAEKTKEKHIVIAGGISVNDVGGHDKFPFNFLNAAGRRAKDFKSSVHIVMYTPSYEIRVKNQKKEHPTVSNHDRTKTNYYYDIMQGLAGKNKFRLTGIDSGSALTKVLNNSESIETIHYFGHANATRCFLDYSSDGKGLGLVFWDKSDAKDVSKSVFTSTAVFASYGCNHGDPGGLAETLRELWEIKTIGSKGKTDFESIGQGKTFPTSADGYVEYPKPTRKADGTLELPPARPVSPF